MYHPEPITMLCSACEAKDLLRCSSGQPIIQAVLNSPTVQRSRSFGFAETVSKTFCCSRGSPQDGASRDNHVRSPGLAACYEHLLLVIPTPLWFVAGQVNAAQPAIDAALQFDPVRFARDQFAARIGDGEFVLGRFNERGTGACC